jgi:hypothetical protein
MSDTTPTLDTDDGGPVKRDMASIKAAAAEAKAPKTSAPKKAASKAANKQAVQDTAPTSPLAAADEVPLELMHRDIPKTAATDDKKWLAYLGPEDQHLCYRDVAPVLFQQQAWSNGWPVALVREGYGMHLVDNCVIKTYSDGSRRRAEDYEDKYVFFDDLGGKKRPAVGRRQRTKA